MGHPRKQRKKFSTPTHPWQKERILAEKELLNSYGLRRKYEIWKMNTVLKNFTTQAKNLIAEKNPQSYKEREQLMGRLSSLGLLQKDSKIEDVLSLGLKDVMERRLQTLVFRRNLARSLKQARQFIIHEHITVGGKTVTAPSYLVPVSEEGNIQFVEASTLADANHPERAIEEEKKPSKKKSEDKKPKEGTEKKSGSKEKKSGEKKESNKPESEAKKSEAEKEENKPGEKPSGRESKTE